MSVAGPAPAGAPAARVHRARLVAAFASVYLFWGGTFLAIRYAVAEVPPLLTIAIRCAAGAALLYLWLWWRREPLRVSRAEWRTAFLAGALLFLGCHALLAWAEQRVSSGQAALLMTATPLFMVLLEAGRSRRAPSRRALAAIGLGTLGVATLTSGAAWTGSGVDFAALMFGALAWPAGSLLARDGARPTSAALSTATQLAAGAVCVLAAAVVVGEPARWDPGALTLRGAASLAFLVVCGTVLGFGAYTWLFRVTSPLASGTYAFVNPVVALLLGWAVGDDVLTTRTAIAAALVVSAVVVTRMAGAAAPRRAPVSVPGRYGVPNET